jgi:hypothetical protein
VKTSVSLLLTATVGSLGGGLFAWIGMPASWLAGSMVAVAAAALAGLPIVVPSAIRNTAFALIGVSMGAGVTREALGQMAAWPLSLAILAISVVATLFASSAYLQRVRGWDAATARFSSVPGAMAAVLILAVTSSADLPRVAFAQSVRLFTLVALIPAILQISGFSGEGTTAVATAASGSPLGVAIMLAVSAGGAWILHSLRVPGGVLLGSMLASALLHGTDIVSGRPPPAILIPGFIATGAVIGARFRGASMAVIRSTLPAALESVLLALLVSAGFAALASTLLTLPFGQLWLAYAPGGVEAMAVMAFALHLDPAFVGAHHVLRILGLNVFSPLWRPSSAKSAPD